MSAEGQKFERLTALRPSARHGYWEFLCDCGQQITALLGNVKRGRTQSCGCLGQERRTKHGLASTPEYSSWTSMMNRCYNPSDPSYPRYGGAGIRVCAAWRDSVKQFIADMGQRPSLSHTLDRIDNTKGYCPENCRWATKQQQSQNKRDSYRYCVDGIWYESARDAAAAHGVSVGSIEHWCKGYWRDGRWVAPKAGCACEEKYHAVA